MLADALVTLRQGWEDLQPAVRDRPVPADHCTPCPPEVGRYIIEHKPLLIALAIAMGCRRALVGGHRHHHGGPGEVGRDQGDGHPTIPTAIDSVITKVRRATDPRRDRGDGVRVDGNRVQFWMDSVKATIDIVMGILTGDWGRAREGLKALALAPLELLKGDLETVLGAVKGIVGDALRGYRT